MTNRIAFVSSLLFCATVGAEEPLASSQASGEGIREVILDFVLSTEDDRPISSGGKVLLEPVDGGKGGRLEIPVTDGRAAAQLPPDSSWRISFRVLGFWAPPGELAVEAEDRTITIPLLPTGSLHGRLESSERIEEPLEYLYLSVESPRANARKRRVGGGKFACPVTDDSTWTCELPADLLDLVFRVPGFVPVYRWDVRIVAGEERDLGVVKLEPGASLAGWLVTADGEPLPSESEARLLPRMAFGPETRMAGKLREGADRRKVGKDGFFQFAGVPAGEYVLVAEGPGYARAATPPIEVREAEETLLREPVVLRQPLDLVVEVDPPLDWQGNSWILSATRASDESGAYDRDPFHRGPVDPDTGRTVLSDQAPGTFMLRIRDSEGNIFWDELSWRVDGEADAERRVELPLIVVHGLVTLGDEPLPASIWYGGRFGDRRVSIKTDKKGLYQGVLPEGGTWRVEVSSGEAQLRIEQTVEVEPGRDRVAEVDLRLPGTEVYGLVLGTDDRPQPGAHVEIESADVDTSARTDAEGRFRARGLPPGQVRLLAMDGGRERASSTVAAVPLNEGAPAGPVILRLRESRIIEGLVLSGGLPVPGALVSALPHPRGGFGDTTRTDATGRFEVRVTELASALHLEISPPNGPLTARQVEIHEEGPMVIELDSDWGEVHVQLPEDADMYRSALRLLQDGVLVSHQAMFQWLLSNGLPPLDTDTQEFTLPRMAPGSYSLCFGDPTAEGGELPCTTGYLQPSGTLELVLR